MWDLSSRPGIEPMPPAMEVLTTGPSEKPPQTNFDLPKSQLSRWSEEWQLNLITFHLHLDWDKGSNKFFQLLHTTLVCF